MCDEKERVDRIFEMNGDPAEQVDVVIRCCVQLLRGDSFPIPLMASRLSLNRAWSRNFAAPLLVLRSRCHLRFGRRRHSSAR